MRSVNSNSNSKGVAAIVGVGPKLGRSIACKFAKEGYVIAILSRDLDKLSRLADEIACEAKQQVYAIRIDCSDSKSVREAFEGVLSLGHIEVLVYNACETASYQPNNFMSIGTESFVRSLSTSALGAFLCAQQVIPRMGERGRGTIIFTGSSASLSGYPGFCELSCGKFALRGLSQCLAKEFYGSGIHIAHIVIHGAIDRASLNRSLSSEARTGTCLDPDAIARSYWYIHTQDKNAWTQELDLRSPNQGF